MKTSSISRLAAFACTVFGLAACSILEGTSASVSPELERFAAQAIIDDQLDQAAMGYRYPEEAIVAHVVSTKADRQTIPPLRVWRYTQGELVEESVEALEKALGSNRSDWPSFTFIFMFESVASGHATIDVHTHYNMGLSPNSRGGNAQRWELENRSGEWVVTRKEPYMFWD